MLVFGEQRESTAIGRDQLERLRRCLEAFKKRRVWGCRGYGGHAREG